MSYCLAGLGAAVADTAIPGLAQLDNDFKATYPSLTDALRALRFNAQQYSGALGRIRQYIETGSLRQTVASAALSTGQAQQLAIGLLARVGLAIAQARRMERAYASGNPDAIRLADRLVSDGATALRGTQMLVEAARSATVGTSGLGLTTAGLTLLVGLFLAPPTMGMSIPGTVLLALAQVATGLDVTLNESSSMFGGLPSPAEAFDWAVPQSIKDAGRDVVNNMTKPLGWVLAVLAGAAAVGVVGYIGWNVYVARKAVRRVTGNRRRLVRRNRGKRFSQTQLRMGIRVEQEHTRKRFTPKLARIVAQQIAEDHLRELPDYYTRLVAMERSAKKSKRAHRSKR